MRISLTDECNLRCIYCHREGVLSFSRGVLDPEELNILVNAAAELGITRVKLTGGEPLMRTDILQVVEAIAGVKGVTEISMTTNGILLAEYALKLAELGLRRVNVNLPSLKHESYRRITGFDLLERVKEGLFKAVEAGLSPIKINMVVLKSFNVDEIPEMIDFALKVPAILQLIELEKLGKVSSRIYNELYYDLAGVEEWLKREALKIVFRSLHNRRKYVLPEGQEVEVVKPFHRRFCMGCSRLRLTADGRLKTCLMREDSSIDIKKALESSDLKELKQLLNKALELREPYF